MKHNNVTYPEANPSEFDESIVSDYQTSIYFATRNKTNVKDLRVLSLFSGCGGMDLGFEGGFLCHQKSIGHNTDWLERKINSNWIKVKPTRFQLCFANDILKDAQSAWTNFFERFDYGSEIYHLDSIVDLVKAHNAGADVFPQDIDVVTGGFPCQDFSVAGKRMGFESSKDHNGQMRNADVPTEETRGKLYFWMKQVIDITKPKVFIAENVKGLMNLGDVKKIIQDDFSHADGDGYIVLNPQVLHAGDYGVPETRERVIFIGIRKKCLTPEMVEILSQEDVLEEYNPYPPKTHAYTTKNSELTEPVVCADVFEGLREPGESNDPAQRIYSKAKYMGSHCQGQTEIKLHDLGPTIRSEHHGNIEFRRLSAEHGGKNLDELNKGLMERRLTPRECALIQTFPPDYPFVWKKKSGNGTLSLNSSGAYKVIGNAVPPILAYNIAMRIQSLWDTYFKH